MAFFAAVVALSILAPGRRATRIDPIQALQHEQQEYDASEASRRSGAGDRQSEHGIDRRKVLSGRT